MTDEERVALATLERLIDTHTLHGVTRMLADICELKAQHIEENWQDRNLAREWRASSRVMEHAAARALQHAV
jgi:hypothetical protein